jgi:hypothetical protein
MIKKTVPLDKIEKKLLQIAYNSNEKKINEKFNWKSLIFALIIAVSSLSVLLFCDNFGIHWLFFLIGLVALIVVYNDIENHPKDKKAAVLQKERLSKLLNLEEAEIYECRCDKALHLFDEQHEGSFYIFEIAENKCIAFSDYYNEMNSLLPNSEFSFFVDENLSGILGDTLKVSGERFIPYKFKDGQPFWGEKSFPAHLEVMNCSLEAYLDEISSE